MFSLSNPYGFIHVTQSAYPNILDLQNSSIWFQGYFNFKHQQVYLDFQWFSQKKEKIRKSKTLKVSGNKMWKFMEWICGENGENTE